MEIPRRLTALGNAYKDSSKDASLLCYIKSLPHQTKLNFKQFIPQHDCGHSIYWMHTLQESRTYGTSAAWPYRHIGLLAVCCA